jgi:hypothetical protein
MTLNEARLIREVKKGCTYRRLTEIYYPELHDGHGNQGWGDELCFEAFKVLYPHLEVHPFTIEPGRYGDCFDMDNKSRIGEFYWWE